MGVLNTSYTASQYKVVSVDKNWVVLRVLDKSLYSTYWKEFWSAKVNAGPTPPGPTVKPMYLRLEQVPPETTLVDQYANFIPELPLVTIEMDGERINVTDRITANTPNTEVPGLFRIDYRINLTAEFSSPIWAVYVSIQQRPILRKAAAGWVRDSYVIQTLNRLVMEPQFLEALHAAGEPLYGFMEANQHPSVRASNLYKYKGLEAWGAGGAYKEDSNGGRNGDAANGIFITGLKLPQGSIVIYQRRMLQLREPVWPDPVGAFHHMDPLKHERTPDAYSKGSVVRDGDSSYICINRETDASIPVSNPDYWRKGYLYKFNVLNGGEDFKLPRERLPVGKGGVEHIWITVDNQGYSFWVDIANQTSIGTYRGYYDRKHYADYGTGDMVTYISEDAIKLFKRKATDIQGQDTLIYPPGHHLNPAWDEVFAKFPEEHQPLFSDYFIVPHTNASNAVLAKTWTVSEEMCEAYGNMMGIPPLIVKECGAKWSALLFALLSRTRNTFEGLRVCFRAVGLDVENLRLSEPSLKYLCNPDGDGLEEVEDVYTQHENLRRLIANIDSLAPEGKEKAEEGCLRYVTENTEGADSKDINVAIQQYSEADGGWVTRYRFERIEPAQNFNNRYYEGDLKVLERLADDAVAKLGDESWVKESAWAGNPSALVAECLAYEIPIYISLRLKILLYAENRIEMQGFVYSGLCDGQRGGVKNVIELFPSRYFSRAAHNFVDVETGVFIKENDGWTEVQPTRYNEARGSKIYEFNGMVNPLRIMAVNPDNVSFVRYWQSTHTFGLLGLADSTSTVNEVPFFNDEHFHNVTDPDITDETELMLMNGYVGVTALYRPKELHLLASARRWMYVLGEESDTEKWELSNDVAFADFANIESTAIYPFEGDAAGLKAVLNYVTDGEGNRLDFEWDGDELVFHDIFPDAIYLRDSDGIILGAYALVAGQYTLTQADYDHYRTDNPLTSVRIGFSYE